MIAVVIPSYRVKKHILSVIAGIGPEVSRIYVVDDRCPEGSGKFRITLAMRILCSRMGMVWPI